jgi:large subunit ribosomal protein L13
MMLIVDAKDTILGRLATFVAKRLLAGEQVAIVNAEQAVISGHRRATFDVYEAWLQTRNVANPRKGPIHLKRPDDLVRMTVRGMLPFDKKKGRDAYRKLKVYVGVPVELKDKETKSLPEASLERLRTRRFIRIGELSKHLSAKF